MHLNSLLQVRLNFGCCAVVEITCYYINYGFAVREFGAGTHLPTPEGWKAELAWVEKKIAQIFDLCEYRTRDPRTGKARII